MNQVLLWTTEQTAEKLAISQRHLCSLIKKQRLPVIRFGGSVRFHPDSIQKWLLEQEHPTATAALIEAANTAIAALGSQLDSCTSSPCDDENPCSYCAQSIEAAEMLESAVDKATK